MCAQAVFGSPIKKLLGETVSLTTTAAHLAYMPGYQEVCLYCASAWRLGLAPKLIHALYYNGTTYTEYVQNVTDRSTSTHMPLDGMAATHYVYLGFSEPVRGFYIDVGSNVNAEAATLDMEYCSTALDNGVSIAFTDVASDSDGSASGGATIAQDGLYTFTLPAVVRSKLGSYETPLFTECYWYRFKPSASLSATVDVNEIIPACDTVNYGYMEAGIAYQFSLNLAQNGAFEFDHASSATLDVTWIQH